MSIVLSDEVEELLILYHCDTVLSNLFFLSQLESVRSLHVDLCLYTRNLLTVNTQKLKTSLLNSMRLSDKQRRFVSDRQLSVIIQVFSEALCSFRGFDLPASFLYLTTPQFNDNIVVNEAMYQLPKITHKVILSNSSNFAENSLSFWVYLRTRLFGYYWRLLKSDVRNSKKEHEAKSKPQLIAEISELFGDLTGSDIISKGDYWAMLAEVSDLSTKIYSSFTTPEDLDTRLAKCLCESTVPFLKTQLESKAHDVSSSILFGASALSVQDSTQKLQLCAEAVADKESNPEHYVFQESERLIYNCAKNSGFPDICETLVGGTSFRLLSRLEKEINLRTVASVTPLAPDVAFQKKGWDFSRDRFDTVTCEEALTFAILNHKYTIIKHLGSGGLGRGWIAVDNDVNEGHGELVFLKTFKSSSDSSKGMGVSDRERSVLAELALAERISSAGSLVQSPFFTTVKRVIRNGHLDCPLNSVSCDGVNAIVTQLGASCSLADVFAQGPSFSEDAASHLFYQMVQMVLVLYDPPDTNVRYFHGDIKAENMVFSLDFRYLMLTDFGSCVRLDPNRPRFASGSSAASPFSSIGMSSPCSSQRTAIQAMTEQLCYQHCTRPYTFPRARVNDSESAEAVDVWSIGLILLVLLTYDEVPGGLVLI